MEVFLNRNTKEERQNEKILDMRANVVVYSKRIMHRV